jgi:hypothetical protein
LKVTVTVLFAVKLLMVQTCPCMASQPVQPPKVEPFGVAVNVIGLPLGKLALQVVEQPRPAGTLVTVPAPVPANVTVRTGPVALKQMTFAVI